MDIHAEDGSSLHLRIVGYQYPELEYEEWDSNWLRIYMAARIPQGAWSVTEPMLLTYEVMELADWFDTVAAGVGTENEIGFVEPNLWFEIVELGHGARALRSHFAAECLPPWMERTKRGTEDVYVDFPLSSIDLYVVAEALRSQLKLYPQRAAH